MKKTVWPNLKRVCGNAVTMYISESGWPSHGPSVGAGIATVTDQRVALTNLNCAARSGGIPIFAFEYDSQLWKNGGVEQSFGFSGKVDLNKSVFSGEREATSLSDLWLSPSTLTDALCSFRLLLMSDLLKSSHIIVLCASIYVCECIPCIMPGVI